jgi:hypothetical protein
VADSRKIEDADPILQEKILLIIEDYPSYYPEAELRILCTLRSIETQKLHYAVGRTIPPIGKKYQITQIDGVNKFGEHNPIPGKFDKSRAVDFGVFINGKYITAEKYYYPLLDLARKYDLISGIDFKNTGQTLEERLKARKQGAFLDFPHLEMKK